MRKTEVRDSQLMWFKYWKTHSPPNNATKGLIRARAPSGYATEHNQSTAKKSKKRGSCSHSIKCTGNSHHSQAACINMDSILPNLTMLSSPSTNSCDTSLCTDSRDESSPVCDCQNQLAHWNWNGVPHEDLPELCKRSMGIPLNDVPISQENSELMYSSFPWYANDTY